MPSVWSGLQQEEYQMSGCRGAVQQTLQYALVSVTCLLGCIGALPVASHYVESSGHSAPAASLELVGRHMAHCGSALFCGGYPDVWK
jgi:hypothetical protein